MNVSMGKSLLNDPDLENQELSRIATTSGTTTAVSTSTDSQRLGDRYDFSKTSQKPINSNDASVPTFKNFRISYHNGGEDTPATIRMYKGNTGVFMQRVVKVFAEYRLDVKKIEITYPVRRQGGSVDELKVKYSEDEEVMRDSLDTMFTYAETDAHLIVRDVQKRVSKARAKKPIEKLFQVYKDIGTVDKKAYEILMSEEGIIDSFVDKSRMMKIVLGSEDAINFLSPAYFLCPLRNCDKCTPILLRSFNNLASVEDHFLQHDVNDQDGPAEVLLKRYKCLLKTDFLVKNRSLSVAEASAKLDEIGFENKSTHSKNFGSLRLPTLSDTFRGKHLHTQHSILMKIINHDDNPLLGVPDRPKNPFEAAKRKKGFIAEADEMTEKESAKVQKTVDQVDFNYEEIHEDDVESD